MNDMSPKIEKEIVAALAAARCGIVRHSTTPKATPKATVKEIPAADRDWLRVASESFSPPTLTQILRVVSARTGVGTVEMQSASRMPRIVRARMMYCALARKLTRWGSPAIGRKVDRDHSTVMHAIAKVAAQTRYFEPEYSEILAAFPGHDGLAE